MEKALRVTKVETWCISLLEKLPVFSYYTNSRGWSYLLSWGHRLAGSFLVVYMFAHIYTLSLLFSPVSFDTEMRFLHNFFFSFLEWAIVIPLIFHSLNGGRLILYELFQMRQEENTIRSMIVLGGIYCVLVGYFFIEQAQPLPAVSFWLITFVISLIALLTVIKKIWPTGNSLPWKLQRITGAFMIPVIVGHMLFMHMNYLTGHDSATIISRIQNPVIKGIDLIFIIFLLYHAVYGVFSIIADYVRSGLLLKTLTFIVIIAGVISAFFGVRLLVAL